MEEKTMQQTEVTDEREAFEVFAQNCPMGKYSITRRGDGYDSSHTQLMWDAWQARAQVQGDPSWWMRETDEGAEWTDTAPLVLSGWTPLYTAPQPAQATQAEVQQPATAIACGIPGMTKTTCPYCEQGFAFEHEQPTTTEPVAVRNPFASRCYTMSESHLSGHRLIVGFEKLEDAQSAHEWVARCGRSNPGELPGMWHESDLIGGETDCEPSHPPHPAPGVPDAIEPPVENGTEYDYCSGRSAGYAEGWNDCRDAMLAASPAQKG